MLRKGVGAIEGVGNPSYSIAEKRKGGIRGEDRSEVWARPIEYKRGEIGFFYGRTHGLRAAGSIEREGVEMWGTGTYMREAGSGQEWIHDAL